MENRCRNCKHYYNGKCCHPDLDANDGIRETILDHIDYAFDGYIQDRLGEVIEQYCSHLDEDEKEDFIESICTCCKNYLTDPTNMDLEKISFSPNYDFCCKYWD